MSTSPFISHQKIFHALVELWQNGRIPHALIFLGPEGIGKGLVARRLARIILCKKTETPCESCQACHLTRNSKHPELIVIEPENNRIKIDTIREIKKSFDYAPLVGDRRVVILNDTHTMNTAAANALLKSLEEPPTGTYFILITHAVGWVPKTIISRCQKVRFAPLSNEELKSVLTKNSIELSESLIPWVQGSVQRALQLKQVQDLVPSLESLTASSKPLSFQQAYDLSQAVVEQDKVRAFLQGLLALVHQYLIKAEENQHRFDLLHFVTRILEIQNRLRQNINAKLHLTRLLLYFQEPKLSRL